MLKMPEGSTYVYELRGRQLFTADDEFWLNEVYSPTGDEVPEGYRHIDGAFVVVFDCPDGIKRAILKQNCVHVEDVD